MADIVVVEDEDVLRRTLARTLEKLGHEVRALASAEEGLSAVEAGPPDVLLSDQRLPGMSGYELMRRVKEQFPEVAVVIMTAYGTLEDAVRAMRDGAADYLRKPVDIHELKIVVERCLSGAGMKKELAYFRRRDRIRGALDSIVGESEAIRRTREVVARIASLHKQGGQGPTILLVAETGTGKGLVARALHEAAHEDDAPFIEVNCTAIPDHLLEAEVFGYEKGAFTDAQTSKPGLVEAAEGGTVFFDEIGRMSPNLQAKLLKVIDEKVVRRLGSTRDRKVSCTIICATHMNLTKEVEEGRFLPDLYHRINVVKITLPPLREREGDILLLADYFLKLHASEYGIDPPELTEAAKAALLTYSWPGNIRELSHTIERAIILRRGTQIDVEDLAFTEHSAPRAPAGAEPAANALRFDFSRGPISLEKLEAELIRAALEHTGGNQVQAAKLLGVSRDTLRYRLEKYGLR